MSPQSAPFNPYSSRRGNKTFAPFSSSSLQGGFSSNCFNGLGLYLPFPYRTIACDVTLPWLEDIAEILHYSEMFYSLCFFLMRLYRLSDTDNEQ
jgi:hypothetical protein